MLFYSCGENDDINQSTIAKLSQYQKATRVLMNNFRHIKQAVNFKDYDSTRQVERYTVINCTKYYFENTVAVSNPDLLRLLSLWNQKLIDIDAALSMNKDSSVTFTTEQNIGTFSGIYHFMVYDPLGNKGGLEKQYSQILKEQKLDNHWYYFIVRKNYVD